MDDEKKSIGVIKGDSFEERSFLSPINANNIEVVFVPSKRKAVRKIDITIEGEFSINNIVLLNDRVPYIFTNYDYVHIILNNIRQLDLTAVQLFYILKSFYGVNNKNISIDAKLSKEDKLLLHKCGFSDLFITAKPNID